ncbi:MAG: hypothetical protein HY676_04215 [Chloroflexi bacterium]|nr:hypothetical protein [Chloroflexota bacterium]
MGESSEEMRAETRAQIALMKEPLFIAKRSPNPDWHLNACLHLGDWDTYAEGYKRAGDILVQYVVDTTSYQDLLVYPIVFLYRQYLELRMKGLTIVGSYLLDQEVEFSRTHDLTSLWGKVRQILEAVFPRDKQENLDLLGKRLAEFNQIDNISDAFRYPSDKKGKPSLPKDMDIINLGHLRDVILGISHVLDGASTGIDAKLDWKAEYLSEMHGYGDRYEP